MNMGLTLGRLRRPSAARPAGPFVFPGSRSSGTALTDMTDAGLLAEQMVWAATTLAAADQAFNIVNGDVFRWRWMWPRLAGCLGVRARGLRASAPRPLRSRWRGRSRVEPLWPSAKALREPDLARVASWWHTDGDLGRDLECFTDMTRSRSAGFTAYRSTLASFLDLFARLDREGVVPAPSPPDGAPRG